MICLVCKRNFHACSSCSFDYKWRYKYCTENCWKSSNKYNDIFNKMLYFCNSLSNDQKDHFVQIFNNYHDKLYLIDVIINLLLKDIK